MSQPMTSVVFDVDGECRHASDGVERRLCGRESDTES